MIGCNLSDLSVIQAMAWIIDHLMIGLLSTIWILDNLVIRVHTVFCFSASTRPRINWFMRQVHSVHKDLEKLLQSNKRLMAAAIPVSFIHCIHKVIINILNRYIILFLYSLVSLVLCCVFQPANGCSAHRLLVKIDLLTLKQLFPSLTEQNK